MIPNAKEAMEKKPGSGEKHTSGVKAHDGYMAFMPEINPPPTQKQSFSAGCKAHSVKMEPISAGLKPSCPC